MAIIVVELNTDDAGDRAILDAVNDLVSDTTQTGASETVVPLKTVGTLPVTTKPATPLKIVPQNIGEELKQELDEIPDPAQAFGDRTAITNPPPPSPEDKPAPPPPPPAVQLDCDGLPWDARIHASTKTKIVSGQWKRKRGVSADTLSIVTEELRNAMNAPAPTTAPAPAIPLPAIDPNLPTTFESFVVAMVKAGKTNADVEPLLVKRGIKGINLLGARPDLIPAIWAELMK